MPLREEVSMQDVTSMLETAGMQLGEVQDFLAQEKPNLEYTKGGVDYAKKMVKQAAVALAEIEERHNKVMKILKDFSGLVLAQGGLEKF